MRDALYAELARQREHEIRRESGRRIHPLQPDGAIAPRGPLTIRFAAGGDNHAINSIAQRSAVAPPTGQRLIAELGGQLVAAISLTDLWTVADAGDAPSDAAELLRLRAAQLLYDRPTPPPIPFSFNRLRSASHQRSNRRLARLLRRATPR
jgi:hypothetical protein